MTNNNQRNRRPYDMERNLEDITLIWCDPNIDDSIDSQRTEKSLKELNNYVQFYTDPQLCLDFIRSIKDEQIIIVLSDVFEKQILSEVYSLRTVCSIFLLCINSKHASIYIHRSI